MKSNNFLRVIIFCFLLFGAFRADAGGLSSKEAREWAEDKGEKLLEAFSVDDLKTKYALLDNLFLSYVDLDYVAQFVVGKYWNVMTGEERQKYKELFKRYALGMYKGFPLSFQYKVKFQILRAAVNGNNAEVTAQIRFVGLPDDDPMQNMSLDFKLYKGIDGIKIRDLLLAGSSLILSYRSRFYRMIAADDGEIAWFIEDFRLQVESIEYTNQLRLEGEYPYRP